MALLLLEDGINAGFRDIGRYFFFLIPFALAIGATAWLTFWMTARAFRKQIGQERRRAIYVNAEERPKAPIKIETRAGRGVIDRVDLEGKEASIYWHNPCDYPMKCIRVRWTLVAPDGTLLASDEHPSETLMGPIEVGPKQKAEARFTEEHLTELELDDRAEKIMFEVL